MVHARRAALHYTAFTGDVTSKRGAADYGLTVAPAQFHEALHLAADLRSGGTAADAISARQMAIAADLIRWIVADVKAAG